VALLRVGLREEAYRSFRRATSAYRDDPQACAGAAVVLASLGEYRVSVSCARHALVTWEGPLPCALYRLAYPAYYADLISTEARARGVDPFLVLALIRQESHFSTYAGSTAGAQGLMQLMPATARWIASRIGVADPTEKLSSPALNVRLGTAFLKMNLDAFDGLEVEALAAYNAGYNRMVRWKKLYGDDEALLAEAIPIEETRDYVRLVLAQEDLYRRLYSGIFPTPPPCSGDEGLLPLVEKAR
jgi:soluble lytic murein transglycosylase